MAQGQSSNVHVVPQASQVMDEFKQQVASEIGIPNYTGYLGDVPSRINGAVGGNMVRRMIALAEQQMAQGGVVPPSVPGAGTLGTIGGQAGGTTTAGAGTLTQGTTTGTTTR